MSAISTNAFFWAANATPQQMRRCRVIQCCATVPNSIIPIFCGFVVQLIVQQVIQQILNILAFSHSPLATESRDQLRHNVTS